MHKHIHEEIVKLLNALDELGGVDSRKEYLAILADLQLTIAYRMTCALDLEEDTDAVP
jgi:hypothetical protein